MKWGTGKFTDYLFIVGNTCHLFMNWQNSAHCEVILSQELNQILEVHWWMRQIWFLHSNFSYSSGDYIGNKVKRLCYHLSQDPLVTLYNNQTKMHYYRGFEVLPFLDPAQFTDINYCSLVPSTADILVLQTQHINLISTSVSLHLPNFSSLHALSLDHYI